MKLFFVTLIAVFFLSLSPSLSAQDTHPNVKINLIHSAPVSIDGVEVQIDFTVEVSSDQPIVVDKNPFVISSEDNRVVVCRESGSDYGYDVNGEGKRFYGTIKLQGQRKKKCEKMFLSIFKFSCAGDTYLQSTNLELR